MTVSLIAGYLYRGEHYCPGCIVEAVAPWATAVDTAEQGLNTVACYIGTSRTHEWFSSHDFPHRVLATALDAPYPVCETCQEELR